MRRALLLTGGAIVLLALAVQLLLPPLIESDVEDGLTGEGGRAEVDLDALPAPRLLWGQGDRIEIRGSGYQLELDEPSRDAFEELDGFDEVDIRIEDFRVGPFEVRRFQLSRARAREEYEMRVDAGASAAGLAEYAGEQLGGPLGGQLGQLGAEALPFDVGAQTVPADLTATLESDGGRVSAKEADASVAGIPAGPLAEALAAAIANRL